MSSTAASKPSTGRKAKTTAAAPVATPVVAAPAPVPVAAPVAAPAHAEEAVNIVAEFATAVEEVNTLRTQLATVFSKMKKLEKQIPRELKKAQKGGRRARKVVDPDAPKKETIFTKPTPISDALCGFLGIAKGSQVSRSEVTSRVCKYAKDKGLMDKQNIKADAALRKLLSLKESDELKILNLQRYLKTHYIKPAVTA
jgi:chromatin remodeling complex protein RSC6